MATTEEILAAARSLGQMIQKHSIYQKLETALKSLQNDTDAQRLLNDYNQHMTRLAEKEAAGQPIEVEEKRKLETLQKQVIGSSNLQKFQVAQMDYLDLMRKVDEAITGNASAGTPASDGPSTTPPIVGL